MDAASFFTFVSSACTIASFLISADLEVTVENVREFLGRIPEQFRDELSSKEGLKLISSMVIDPKTLEFLKNQVIESEKTYLKCLKKGKSPQERYACDQRAGRGICETLNRIRDLNEKDIPTDFLNKRWVSFRCVPY